MRDLGYVLFGIVDGLVLAGVFAGLTWAAIHDGRDERAFQVRVKRERTAGLALVPA